MHGLCLFFHIIYRYLKHDAPSHICRTHRVAKTNQPHGVRQVRQFYYFICLLLSPCLQTILFVIPCVRKDLYNHSHARTLILHLIWNQISCWGVKNINQTRSLKALSPLDPTWREKSKIKVMGDVTSITSGESEIECDAKRRNCIPVSCDVAPNLFNGEKKAKNMKNQTECDKI